MAYEGHLLAPYASALCISIPRLRRRDMKKRDGWQFLPGLPPKAGQYRLREQKEKGLSMDQCPWE